MAMRDHAAGVKGCTDMYMIRRVFSGGEGGIVPNWTSQGGGVGITSLSSDQNSNKFLTYSIYSRGGGAGSCLYNLTPHPRKKPEYAPFMIGIAGRNAP